MCYEQCAYYGCYGVVGTMGIIPSMRVMGGLTIVCAVLSLIGLSCVMITVSTTIVAYEAVTVSVIVVDVVNHLKLACYTIKLRGDEACLTPCNLRPVCCAAGGPAGGPKQRRPNIAHGMQTPNT